MRRFRKEFGLKKARILRERLIPVSQRLKIGINRHPLSKKRRWWDLNPRTGNTDLPHFECGPFNHLGTSPEAGTMPACLLYTIILILCSSFFSFSVISRLSSIHGHPLDMNPQKSHLLSGDRVL